MHNPIRELPAIAISTTDFPRVQKLAEVSERHFPHTADFLARELGRARVMRPEEIPADVVRMGSELEFRDDTTGATRWVTLVYPPEADLAIGRISVLTPIGAALIGLSVGQSIEWHTVTGGVRSLTVLRVAGHAPEGKAPRDLATSVAESEDA
jgi:regulator of nucleoside diphosphate kinase